MEWLLHCLIDTGSLASIMWWDSMANYKNIKYFIYHTDWTRLWCLPSWTLTLPRHLIQAWHAAPMPHASQILVVPQKALP